MQWYRPLFILSLCNFIIWHFMVQDRYSSWVIKVIARVIASRGKTFRLTKDFVHVGWFHFDYGSSGWLGRPRIPKMRLVYICFSKGFIATSIVLLYFANTCCHLSKVINCYILMHRLNFVLYTNCYIPRSAISIPGTMPICYQFCMIQINMVQYAFCSKTTLELFFLIFIIVLLAIGWYRLTWISVV